MGVKERTKLNKNFQRGEPKILPGEGFGIIFPETKKVKYLETNT